jgi:thiol-disulfide isomerase/thioredoxin
MPTAARPAVRAPRLSGGPWLNGEPPGGWQGHVTLVEFWTYSCVNCLRTLPALRAWQERYAAHGLTVVGIHTPEFPFERDPANVARAINDLGAPYPVILDNDRALWSAFANRYWPHRYLIDPTGRIAHDYAGEGGEAGTEAAIRALLAAHTAGPLPPPIFSPDSEAWPEAAMGAVCVPATPELFAGYYRGVSGNPGGFAEDRDADYADPGDYREGYIHLAGRWHVGADSARFVGPAPGALRVAFRGLSPNVVLAPPATGAARVAASVIPLARADDADLPKQITPLAVDTPRLYALPGARDAPPGEPLLLLLRVATPGLEIFSFTFESCADGCGRERAGEAAPAR